MSYKSLTKNISVDKALRTHKCRGNKRHLIEVGEKRLKIKEGRSDLHYCKNCAKRFIEIDIEKLNNISNELKN